MRRCLAKFARFFDAGAEEELYDVEKGIALFQKSGEKEKTDPRSVG